MVHNAPAEHIEHLDRHFERVPYCSLPVNDLHSVIAPSCCSCFDL